MQALYMPPFLRFPTKKIDQQSSYYYQCSILFECIWVVSDKKKNIAWTNTIYYQHKGNRLTIQKNENKHTDLT